MTALNGKMLFYIWLIKWPMLFTYTNLNGTDVLTNMQNLNGAGGHNVI